MRVGPISVGDDAGREVRSLRTQGTRFVLAGAATAALDYLTLFLLTEYAGLGYFLSAAIGFMVGSTSNYVISSRWVFVPGKYRQSVEYTLFMVTSVGGLVINQFAMWFIVEVALIHYLLAKIIAIAAVAAWNFVLKKKFVFAN